MRTWEWAAVAVAVVLALALRGAAVHQYEASHPQAERPVIDEAAYEAWGLELAAGDWLGDEVFFQEPLYPYAIGAVYAVFGHERTTLRWLQAVLGASTVALLFLLTRRAFGPVAAVVAAFALALHRPSLLFPALLLKPNLFLPVLVLLALALVRTREGSARRWLAVGVLSGLGVLLRGNVLILMPAFLLWPLARARLGGTPVRSALPSALYTFAGAVLVLAPVAVRNQVVGGVFALSTSGAGTNLYGGNNLDNPYGRATEFDWVRGIPAYEADDWRHEAERRFGRELDAGEVSRYWVGEVLDSVRRQPLAHAGILWRKLRLTLGAYEVPDNHHLEWDARYVSLVRAPFPGWGLLGALSLAGILLFLSSRDLRGGAGADLAVLFLLYLATIVLTVTSMRGRLPLVPLGLPFAGLFAADLIERLRKRAPARELARAVLCLGAGLAVTLVPVFDAGEVEADIAKRDFNHAVHLIEAGNLDEAEGIALRLDADYPGSSRVLSLLASIEFERAGARAEAGDREGAEELLGVALGRLREIVLRPEVNPREKFRANHLAGRIQFFLGNWEVAERRFRDATAFDPEDDGLAFALANVLFLLAVDMPEGEARTARFDEAEILLLDILDRGGGAEVEARLAELRATR